LQGNDFKLAISIPLPDPRKGSISDQELTVSNFDQTATDTFEFKNQSSFNLRVSSDTFNELVQREMILAVKHKNTVICESRILINQFFLAENYRVDESFSMVKVTSLA